MRRTPVDDNKGVVVRVGPTNVTPPNVVPNRSTTTPQNQILPPPTAITTSSTPQRHSAARASPPPPIIPGTNSGSTGSSTGSRTTASTVGNPTHRRRQNYSDFQPDSVFVVCTQCQAAPVASPAKIRPRCSLCHDASVVVAHDPRCWAELCCRGVAARCGSARCEGEGHPAAVAEFTARCGRDVDPSVAASSPARFRQEHGGGRRTVCNAAAAVVQALFDNSMAPGYVQRRCVTCNRPSDVMLFFPEPCTHAVCPGCFVSSWGAKIRSKRLPWNPDKKMHGINCPVGCPVFIHDASLLKLCGERDYQQYSHILSNEIACLGSHGIYCSTLRCSSEPFLPTNIESYKALCTKCENRTCVRCLQESSACSCVYTVTEVSIKLVPFDKTPGLTVTVSREEKIAALKAVIQHHLGHEASSQQLYLFGKEYPPIPDNAIIRSFAFENPAVVLYLEVLTNHANPALY
ncbi:hypothetical protein Pelo_3794 [Pelomyxa schiedti]|nr:hypothetical protein Pelo_3794 [Pelomyxa schiedti]